MDSRGGVAQLVRANGSYPLGQQFKSARRYHLPDSSVLRCCDRRGMIRLILDEAHQHWSRDH